MRVFFDASVIIAALLSPTGASSLLLRLTKTGTLVGVTSQSVVDEVLAHSEKLHTTKDAVEWFIATSGLVVRESVTLDEIVPYHHLIDKEDAHLIAGARQTKCEYLVSLDKRDVLRTDIRERFQPLRIVSPKELLSEVIRA